MQQFHRTSLVVLCGGLYCEHDHAATGLVDVVEDAEIPNSELPNRRDVLETWNVSFERLAMTSSLRGFPAQLITNRRHDAAPIECAQSAQIIFDALSVLDAKPVTLNVVTSIGVKHARPSAR